MHLDISYQIIQEILYQLLINLTGFLVALILIEKYKIDSLIKSTKNSFQSLLISLKILICPMVSIKKKTLYSLERHTFTAINLSQSLYLVILMLNQEKRSLILLEPTTNTVYEKSTLRFTCHYLYNPST